MTTIVISIDDDPKRTDGGKGAVTRPAPLTDSPTKDVNGHVDRNDLLEVLQKTSEDAITIRRDTEHLDWERGESCPECGNEILHVMELGEITYQSSDGEFTATDEQDLTGPQLSIVCPDCNSHLLHVPYYTLI